MRQNDTKQKKKNHEIKHSSASQSKNMAYFCSEIHVIFRKFPVHSHYTFIIRHYSPLVDLKTIQD